MDSDMSGDAVDDLIDWIFAPPFTLPQGSAPQQRSTPTSNIKDL